MKTKTKFKTGLRDQIMGFAPSANLNTTFWKACIYHGSLLLLYVSIVVALIISQQGLRVSFEGMNCFCFYLWCHSGFITERMWSNQKEANSMLPVTHLSIYRDSIAGFLDFVWDLARNDADALQIKWQRKELGAFRGKPSIDIGDASGG